MPFVLFCLHLEIENKCPQLNMVWLHCDGEDDPDKENIGPVSQTFPHILGPSE